MSNEEGHRFVQAIHGLRTIEPDPDFELAFSNHLRNQFNLDDITDIYARFMVGEGRFDTIIRRVLWRVMLKKLGNNLRVGSNVEIKHPETIEIGDNVFIGSQTYIQGRFDGQCIIGNHVWIGPQSYFDARNLTIGDYVGWGPGAKVLGSSHTGIPIDVPIIETDLEIKPVIIEEWADIGVNAIVLPGVIVGKGSIVGAGAVVTKNIPPFAVVAGVPAKFLHWRKGHQS